MARLRWNLVRGLQGWIGGGMLVEYLDDHTRAAVLKGGSHYRPQYSLWYFPQAKELGQHGKLLLMAPSIDRSGTVGFRCVKDAE